MKLPRPWQIKAYNLRTAAVFAYDALVAAHNVEGSEDRRVRTAIARAAAVLESALVKRGW